MKNINKILSVLLLAFLAFGCQEDDIEFGDVTTPSNLTVTVTVANDQTGNVTVKPTAENTLNFHVYFRSDADAVVIANGEEASFRYTQDGQYTQEIVVTAFGTGGASSTKAVIVELDVRLIIEEGVLLNIAGPANEEKRWVWDSSNAGHFGVGDPAETFPNFFSAGANQLDPCLYDDVLIFSHDGENNYRFQLETTDATFINWAEIKRFFPDADPQIFVDECRNIDDQIDLDTRFVIVDDEFGNPSLTVTNSTMSYWSGAEVYQILELTADKLVIRGVQDPFDPPGDQLAWYHTFVPEDGAPPPTCNAFTGDTGSGNNDVLVWAEEFDEDGAPCAGTWNYDIGANGWGNDESQYYTDRSDNVIISGGTLKITAKAEEFQGSEFTSARINTYQKFEFEYGRIEARAKLPTGGGTWPAMWLLGNDFVTNTWPACGEMDFMEHVGNNQDRIFSSLHYPGNSGGNAQTQSIEVPGASDEFHIYAMEWSPTQIVFFVDGEEHFTFQNNVSLPFDHEFFVILNVAMGGTFGGAIDPNFVESTLEVDYVRVYQ